MIGARFERHPAGTPKGQVTIVAPTDPAVQGLPRPIERTDIGPEHYQRWVDWAKERRIGLDFNPTLF